MMLRSVKFLLSRVIPPAVPQRRRATGNTRRFCRFVEKILNVEKKPISKVLENAEIKALINAFGCGFMQGYGNDF